MADPSHADVLLKLYELRTERTARSQSGQAGHRVHFCRFVLERDIEVTQ